MRELIFKVVHVRSAQQERGHLLALAHAESARREHTRGLARLNVNHAAKDRSPNRKRRHVPSVWLDTTPISMKAYANLAWKTHTPLNPRTPAWPAQKALIQGLARRNAAAVVQGKTSTIRICLAQIAIRPTTPLTPTNLAANAQLANTQALGPPSVRSAQMELQQNPTKRDVPIRLLLLPPTRPLFLLTTRPLILPPLRPLILPLIPPVRTDSSTMTSQADVLGRLPLRNLHLRV